TVFGPRGVVVAEFLLQFLEYLFREALPVGAAVQDLQSGDFGFVLLDVIPERRGELGAGLRAFLGRPGVDQCVPRDDVNGLVGGLLDLLEEVAEIGIRGQWRESGFGQLFGNGFEVFRAGFNVDGGRLRRAVP